MWKTILAVVFVAPFVAMFAGIGTLFFFVGRTWDKEATHLMIVGLNVTLAAVAGLIILGVFAIIAARIFQRRDDEYGPMPHIIDQPQRQGQLPGSYGYANLPPVNDPNIGSFQAAGPAAYATMDQQAAPPESGGGMWGDGGGTW